MVTRQMINRGGGSVLVFMAQKVRKERKRSMNFGKNGQTARNILAQMKDSGFGRLNVKVGQVSIQEIV